MKNYYYPARFIFKLAVYIVLCILCIPTVERYLFYFTIISPSFTVFAAGVLLIWELISRRRENHAFSIIAFLLALASLITELTSSYLELMGTFVVSVWVCWLIEFIVRQVRKRKSQSDAI